MPIRAPRSGALLAALAVLASLLVATVTTPAPARAAGASAWSTYLWPDTGLCRYSPAGQPGKTAATYRVTKRTSTKATAKIKAGSVRATESFTLPSSGRLGLKVTGLKSGGTTVSMGEPVVYPTVSGVRKKKSRSTTVPMTVVLPPSQEAKVKPYLTHGSHVQLSVGFKVTGLGRRTVGGVQGIGVRITVGSINPTNVKSEARSTVRDAARSYVSALGGVQWYAAGVGLVAVGGQKANASDAALLSSCS